MSTERVEILIQANGGQEALALMQKLDQSINRLNNKKAFTSLSGLSKSKAELQSYTNELERLYNLRSTKLDAGLSTKSVDAAIRKTTNSIREMSAAEDQATRKSVTLGEAMRTNFNRISSLTMHAGQQMQVLGKTLTQISSPMRTLFRSTVWAAGFKALNMATSGLSGAFERYDIMKNYEKSLNALGLDASKKFVVGTGQAQTAVENLNDAVLGLPTGLDEIIAAQKVYAGATGEMVTSTKTAIAANNTFLASDMDARNQRFMQRYLVALASGAELTKNQWISMGRIAPLAMRAVAKELGYAVDDAKKGKEEYQRFSEEVQSGTIKGVKFLEAFNKVGIEGSVAAAANVMKTTFEGLSANVQNAFRRMGEGLLTAVDDVFMAYNGRNLIQNLLGVDAKGNEVGTSVKKIIDGFSASLQGWVRANPDKIMNFLNTLRSFDWKGLATGVGRGLEKTIDDIQKLFDLFSGVGGEKIGYFFARAPLWGKFLTIIGGFLKGSRGIVAAAGTLLSTPFLTKMVDKGGFAGFFGRLLGGKRSIEQVTEVGEMATATGKASAKLIAGFKNIALMSGSLLAIAGTGFLAFKAMNSIMNDIKTMTDTAKGIDWNMAKEVLTGMGVFFASFAGLSFVLGGLPEVSGILIAGEVALGALTAIASGFLALDMKLLKSAFRNFKDVTESLKDALENVSNLESVTINKDAIKGAVSSLATVYELLKPKYQGQGIENMSAREAKRMKTVVESMVKTLESLKDLKGVAKELSGFEVFSEELATNVQSAFKSLGTMFTGFTEAFGISAETNTKEASNIIGNIKDTFDNLVGDNGVLAQIKKISPAISEITSLTDKGSILIEARSGIERLFNEIGNLFDGFAGKIGFNAESNTSLASNVMENVHGLFDTLIGKEGIIAQVGKLATEMPKITSGGYGGTQSLIGQVRDYLQDLFKGLGEIYNSIIDPKEGLGLYQNVTEGSSSTANEVLNNVNAMFASLIGKDGIITKLMSMSESLPNLVGSAGNQGRGATPIDNVKTMIKRLFSAINDIFTFMNGETMLGDSGNITVLTEAIGQLPQIMTSIQQAITTIQGLSEVEFDGDGGISETISQIQGMIQKLTTAFNAETISMLTAQVEGFKQTVSTLIDSITSMQGMSAGNPVELSITFSHTITGADEAVAAIRAADTAIRNAVNAITLSYNRTIHVYLTPRVHKAPMPDTSYYPHTGGYIGKRRLLYRSKGGDVLGSIFKPRGTDTVPAMLTAGEYVQRKRAVDFFGIDFMRKINNLDVRGAMNELLTRAGGMANVGRQTIINNTYNNNQKVVQNIKTDSPDFAFRSASRFAGAF